MILVSYRLLSTGLALLAAWALLREGTRQQKAAAAILLVPLVLRALLIKSGRCHNLWNRPSGLFSQG